jgi:hypothetical protein
MEAIKILDKKENLNWDYDEEADVLYSASESPGRRPELTQGE